MPTSRLASFTAVLVLAACGGPSSTDGGADRDGGGTEDAGAERDAGADRDAGATEDAGTIPDAGPPTCSAGTIPDLGTTVQLARGLVVARDGTLYFTQVGGVGRRLPDGTLETGWATFGGGGGVTFVALALDADNTSLFATAPDFSGTDAASVYRVDTTSGAATPVVMGGRTFGVAVGPDEMLYLGGGAGDHVYRVSASGGSAPTQVTTSEIPSPRGLAFEASGTLLVASASPGSIVRITLSSTGTETDRQTVTSAPTPDSIAIDASGRIYFTSEFGGFLARMNPDGSAFETLEPSLSSPFALDFGHGALSTCALFFVAGGLVRSLENDTPGATTLWH